MLFLSAATIALAAWVLRSPIAQHSPAVHRYRTLVGQQMTVRWADGSSMLVGPASTVTTSELGIDVAGEAYFSIVPHSAHPVIVRTPHLIARVLGTRFSVRHYASDDASRVAVDDGKVVVRLIHAGSRSGHTVLSARTMAVATDSGIATVSGDSVREYTVWSQGRLVFDKIPLRNVVREISRMYGTELRVVDSTLSRQLMTMTVSVTTESLTQVLEVIAFAHHAHVVRDGDAYVLVPGRNVTRSPASNLIPQPEKSYGK